jgi:transposase
MKGLKTAVMMEGNKYYRRSRIPEWKFRTLVRHFAQDMSATEVAHLTGLTRKTVTTIFLRIRRRIAQDCSRRSPFATGRLKPDESRACTTCVCGARCAQSHRTPVFALLSHEKRVYTEMVPDCRKATLRALIRGRLPADGPHQLNGWHGFDGLIDIDYGKPFKVGRPAACGADADGVLQPLDSDVEDFWGFVRARLGKFYGVSNRTFHLHLKECEWRYNLRGADLYAELLKLLGNYPL